jgi:hypothetical protein
MKALCGDMPFLLIHHPPHNDNRAAGHHSLSANCSNEWFLSKTKLQIKKGRLVALKQIMLSRDINGLWISDDDGDSLIDQYPDLDKAI